MSPADGESLDSRALRYTDCFGQRLMKAGRYAYNALPLGAHVLNDERPHVIQVRPRTSASKMTQWTVALAWDGRRFVPDTPDLEVESGDLVLWHCGQPAAPPYAVVGDKAFFSSAALAGESGYSHAFLRPGTYEWGDALGSGVGGTVVVADPQADSEAKVAKWKKTLAKGTVVMVANGKADPARVEIVAGQTVFFTIVSGPTTITDRTLIGPRGDPDKPKRRTPK